LNVSATVGAATAAGVVAVVASAVAAVDAIAAAGSISGAGVSVAVLAGSPDAGVVGVD
jgi:hypothetical protein